jgi:hypothetical protein
MDKKFKLGQFYTTRSKYIIGNLIDLIPKNAIVVEPFCGNGDLLIINNQFELYDIDPKIPNCEQRDTLKFPPNYKNKFVITNPPFLARNKNSDKGIYDLYGVNDLYKASIKSLIDCDGGILIVPLNFLCDEDDSLREFFFSEFDILKLNVFEETVFDDTAYTICSFFFTKKKNKESQKISFECMFFPSLESVSFDLEKRFGYKIGGEFFKILEPYKKNHEGVSRLKDGEVPNSNIFLRAIDTGSATGRISLSIEETHHYGKKSDRAFASINFNRNFSLDQQTKICNEFNEILESYRKKYKSMFLTNFRNSSSLYARKRISFDASYSLINYIIAKENL